MTPKLPKERQGEIVVEGPNVMKGYLGLKETTRSAFNEAGAFRTGDLGYIDAGRLPVHHRAGEGAIQARERQVRGPRNRSKSNSSCLRISSM